MQAVQSRSSAGTPQRIVRREPLSAHSTWKIGGPADFFIEPSDLGELRESLAFSHESNIPFLIIGEGSNLLFADDGFRGLVIKLGKHLSTVTVDGTRVEAQAGVLACRLARACCKAGLAGLEHIVGIPGTLGGLVVMNGGSMRRGIGENITAVEVMDEHGRLQTLRQDQCEFGYRASRFQHCGGIIVRVHLELQVGDTPTIRKQMLKILAERRRKFPRKLPNCGSVFKSSPELFETVGPPGKVIEQCGFKGKRLGDAEVSPLHANFIVNRGAATARDVLQLIREIRSTVMDRFGVAMDAEAKYVSPDGRIVPAHEVSSPEASGERVYGN